MEGLPVGHVVAVGAAALSERTRRARPRMVKNQPVAHDGNRGLMLAAISAIRRASFGVVT